MLSMAENLLSFLKWLEGVMAEKKVSAADIARTGLVTDSAVSLLFSMKTKSVSKKMCEAISIATGIPLVTVYQVAGYMAPSSDPWVEGMAEKMNKLSPAFRPIAERLLDSLIEQEKAEKQLKPKAAKP